MVGDYLIAIASYRRPSGLRHLLDSLHTTDGSPDAEVIVVDNDPEESARPIATGHPLRPAYVVEPVPGIAAARNRALQHFSTRHRAIIFVDDDEQVAPDWLTRLTAYATGTQADVVQGPVIGIFPPDAPPWVSRGGFVQRRVWASGTQLLSAATNNTLLRRDSWLRAGSPGFDDAFSATGGSDTEFFWRMRKSGSCIHFCADAVVYEDVPADRLSVTWVRRRAIRNGIAETRVRSMHGDLTVAWLTGSLVRGACGMALLGVGMATGRGLLAKPFNDLFKAYGHLAALVNHRIVEYAGPSPHGGSTR
jgi:succinoglycan biosynthesis protein ExoM